MYGLLSSFSAWETALPPRFITHTGLIEIARLAGCRGGLKLRIPQTDRQRQQQIVVLPLPPGGIAVVRRLWVNRQLEIQQFLRQRLGLGEVLNDRQPTRTRLKERHRHADQ